jgi:membrane protease subunit HflK
MPEEKKEKERNNHGFRIRMAALVTGINAVLTALKFLLYYFSGSMAILAEAWHSFADIGTSLLVFLALLTEKSRRGSENAGNSPRSPGKYTELGISLGIGLMLTAVSCYLIYNFFTADHRPIDNSLASGLIFLFFSFISYAVYRFETRLGEAVNSIGLISDGMHSRADMAASMITGFALILYTMGINLDRWVSLLIALFVLSFAMETVMNVIGAFYRRGEGPIRRYSFHEAIFVLFDSRAFHENVKRARRAMKTTPVFEKLWKTSVRILLVLTPLALIASVSSTLFFTVTPREVAVVERFGKPAGNRKPVLPGLHVKWPWPVDRVVKVDVAGIKSINIGNIMDDRTTALLWTRNHGSEEPFLTGDNNFFYPYLVVDYRIKDVFKFLYMNRDPEQNLNEAAHRIATHAFSRQRFYDIASTNRSRLAGEIAAMLQSFMDELDTGIEIVTVNLRDIHPPITVAEAFERVIAGYQDKQKIINDALGYRYNKIPRARATADETVETATGYAADRIKSAEGASSRFIMSTPASEDERELATIRIHLDTIREALKDRKKIVIDPNIGITNIWMNYGGAPEAGIDRDNRKDK